MIWTSWTSSHPTFWHSKKRRCLDKIFLLRVHGGLSIIPTKEAEIQLEFVQGSLTNMESMGLTAQQIPRHAQLPGELSIQQEEYQAGVRCS